MKPDSMDRFCSVISTICHLVLTMRSMMMTDTLLTYFMVQSPSSEATTINVININTIKFGS